MSTPILRPLTPDDTDAAVSLWQRCFDDAPDWIRRTMAAGRLMDCAVGAFDGGALCSAMYAVPGLEYCGKRGAYLYALGTAPEARGRGLGGAVLEALAEHCFRDGAEFVVLMPGSAGLRDWYIRRFSMLPLAPMADCPVPVPEPTASSGCCRPLDAAAYAAARCRFSDLSLPLALLRAQEADLLPDGGCCMLELPGCTALACVRSEERRLQVLELLCPPEAEAAALGLLCRRFHAEGLSLRRPAADGLSPLYRCADSGVLPAAARCRFPLVLD